jgi:oligopeptide transport system permease protein
MGKYAVRRILWIIPVLLGVSTLTFFIMHFVPGGPWDGEKALDPTVVENLNRRYGLDEPVWKQYVNFLGNALQGDLGVSYTYQDRSVTDIILEGLPKSAALGLLAFAIAFTVGVSLGTLSAVKQNSVIDYISVGFSTLFASIPGFVLAFLLILTFSVTFHLLPTGGWGSPKHLILPAIALAALPAAYIARITRAAVLDLLKQDYMRTARAKGLRPPVIYYRHALRNAFVPILTVSGPQLAALITGSFIIEQIFAIPGIGRFFVQGVFQRDYGLIMGAVLFYAAVIAAFNLAVDLLYGLADPRVRYQ